VRKILVDSSIWISYFKNNTLYTGLDKLISDNQICINDLILAELIPFLKVKNQNEIIDSLLYLDRIPLQTDWNQITNYQITNLKKGINKVGIPDLIILDNVITNNLVLFTEDKHFKLMQKNIVFDLYEYNF
jgi:predicted nucleic acid-binding protein